MKYIFFTKLILIVFTGLLLPAAELDAQSKTNNKVEMTFKERNIDLGKVNKGDKIAFFYEFTNTGSEDIAIDFISGCDCTELDWPVKTFKPGQSGKIDVIFLSGKKEESETVEIDVLLKNVDSKTKNPILEILSYTFKF